MKPKHLLPLLACLFLFTGCGSTPSKVAYQTLNAVGAAEDKAMMAAAAARHQGALTDAQWQQVAQVHAKFQTSFNTACDLAGFDKTQPVPAQVSNIVVELITLLNQFGVKLNL